MTLKESKEDFIYGFHALKEAVLSGKELNKILIQKGIQKEKFEEVKQLLSGKKYTLQFVPIQKLNKLTQNNHQGIVAFAPPIEYFPIEPLVDQWIEEDKKVSILVLDRITDVRNFGAIARTAECMGIEAILIPSKGSALVTSDAMRASSGALNRIKVCRTDHLKNTLFYIQQSGFRIITVTEKSTVPLYEINLRGNIAIVMGSEQDGITQDLINLSDLSIRIPMQGEVSSLNVSVAAGMVLYERSRQLQKD
jgi:23S rRNA (guanosine2251-2'-O)-methyltransferase